MRKTLLFALPLGLLLLTGCSTPATPPTDALRSPSASSSPSAEPTVAVKDEPTGTRNLPYPVGTFARVDETSIWDFTVHDVQLDANAWVAQADAYNEAPSAGNVYVGGYIKVNVRDIAETAALTEPVSPGASLNPVFVGASGTVYDFWTSGLPATFGGQTWNSLPDVFVTPTTTWDQAYAMQVPASDVDGGSFAVRHSVTGKVVFFV